VPLPRGRLLWWGRARVRQGGITETKPVALVEFDTVHEQTQFVNSGVMDLQFSGDDADTIAFAVDPQPKGPTT
jgi:hypothetical protein